MQKRFLSLSISALMLANLPAIADDNNVSEPSVQMGTMYITSRNTDAEVDYVGKKANALLKSDDVLFDTAKSVSIITQSQLQQKQATSVSEALKGVAGVSTGQYGRRGWDDFVIRGQFANSQVMIDGMRSATSRNFLNSFDVSGLESVEVVKGAESVNFGALLPSGVVNLTSKKPKNTTFKNVSISAGSDGFLQGAFDINYAKNNSTDGAFRVNGRVAESDDPTDYVYFKNYYIAPSYQFKPNEKSDVTLSASYQGRKYIRQQGMPAQEDIYKKYPSSFFFGDPNRYLNDESLRLGYQLDYKLDNGWKLFQNFAFTKREADGSAVIANGNPIVKNNTMGRQLNDQLKQDTIFSLDNRLTKNFQFGDSSHDVSVGLDGFRERSDYQFLTCTYGTMDLNTGVANNQCTNASKVHNNTAINHLQYVGLYAKDTMRLAGFRPVDNWVIGLGGRYDWSKIKSNNQNLGLTKKSDKAFSINASAMYQFDNKFAPYVSYSTSFLPNTDKGVGGKVLDPETGSQREVGVKWQNVEQTLQGSLSYYDITRKNVSEKVDNDYYDLVGKQQTKGYEMEVKAFLNDQWNISASYSHIPTAKVVAQSPIATNYNVGDRLNHVAKNAYSLGTQYYFEPSKMGWYVGAMYRYEDKHHAKRGKNQIVLPSYTLFDLETGYNTPKWGVDLSVQNLFDEKYYSGTSPNVSMVTHGDPRTWRLKFNYKF